MFSLTSHVAAPVRCARIDAARDAPHRPAAARPPRRAPLARSESSRSFSVPAASDARRRASSRVPLPSPPLTTPPLSAPSDSREQTNALRVRGAKPLASSRRASVAVRAADGEAEDVYIGKGRWVKDDPKKYASRDDWFTGGWPGGEVGLKEGFINEPFEKPPPSSPLNRMPEDVEGDDVVYVGKGKFARGVDATKFSGRDNLLTGGWAGGEVGLKVGEKLKLKPGDYVEINGAGGILAFLKGGKKTGTVKKVEVGNMGNVKVTVAVLPFDNVEVFNGDQIVKIDER